MQKNLNNTLTIKETIQMKIKNKSLFLLLNKET